MLSYGEEFLSKQDRIKMLSSLNLSQIEINYAKY